MIANNATILWNTSSSCMETTPDINAEDVIKGVVFLIIITLSLLGNLLVFISVLRTYKLRQQIANYFVMSLAVADFLVAIVAMFFNGITIIFHGHWLFGPLICDLYNAMDVVFCTASILNLFFISLYRYYQIVKEPLSYGETFSRTRVLLIIAFIWLISFVIAFVPIFSRIYTTAQYLEEQASGHRRCRCNFIVNLPYCIVSSSISFWIPSAGICYFYYHIYRLAAKTAREDAQRKQSNCTTNTLIPNHNTHYDKTPTIMLSSSPIKEDAVALDDEDECPNTSKSSSSFLSVKSNKDARSRSLALSGSSRLPIILPPNLTSHTPQSSSISETAHETLKAHIKAAKTLLIILLTFFVCWAPFFINYVLTFVASLEPSDEWVSFVFWLGYFNSLLNPFIYAWKFQDFQNAFVDTLGSLFCNCCSYSSSRRNRAESAWQTTKTSVNYFHSGNRRSYKKTSV